MCYIPGSSRECPSCHNEEVVYYEPVRCLMSERCQWHRTADAELSTRMYYWHEQRLCRGCTAVDRNSTRSIHFHDRGGSAFSPTRDSRQGASSRLSGASSQSSQRYAHSRQVRFAKDCEQKPQRSLDHSGDSLSIPAHSSYSGSRTRSHGHENHGSPSSQDSSRLSTSENSPRSSDRQTRSTYRDRVIATAETSRDPLTQGESAESSCRRSETSATYRADDGREYVAIRDDDDHDDGSGNHPRYTMREVFRRDSEGRLPQPPAGFEYRKLDPK